MGGPDCSATVGLVLAIVGRAASDIGKKLFKKFKGGILKEAMVKRLRKKLAVCRLCFPAGTLVETERGMRAIETIETGERVWARDERTGEWRLAEVVEPLRREFRGELVTLQVDGETIAATDGHPFWVESGEHLDERPRVKLPADQSGGGAVTGRWVYAADLALGDRLISRSGGAVAIESIERAEVEIPTFNLHVAELHTYTVGNLALWVHNASKKKCRKKKKDAPEETPDVKASPFGDKVESPVPKDGVPTNWSRTDIEDAIVDYRTSIASRNAEQRAFALAGTGSEVERLAHFRRISEEESFLHSLQNALENRR